MTDKRTSAITARRQARERLAHERAEQAERNRKNEDDLVEYLMLGQRLEKADSDHDAAMARARDHHSMTVAELKNRQAACIVRMTQHGEPIAAIADRIGSTTQDVKQIISRTSINANGPTPESKRRKRQEQSARTREL